MCLYETLMVPQRPFAFSGQMTLRQINGSGSWVYEGSCRVVREYKFMRCHVAPVVQSSTSHPKKVPVKFPEGWWIWKPSLIIAVQRASEEGGRRLKRAEELHSLLVRVIIESSFRNQAIMEGNKSSNCQVNWLMGDFLQSCLPEAC